MRLIQEYLPWARIGWSDIIPRQQYQYARSDIAMGNVRKRVNEHALIINLRACGWGAPHNISPLRADFFHDTVHLNDSDNDIFVSNLATCVSNMLQLQ